MERDAAAAHELIIPLHPHTELRAMRMEDAADLFSVIDRNRQRLHEWLPWAGPDYSIAAARDFLATQIAEMAARQSLTLTIRHKRALCGVIALHRIDETQQSTSIGYWIDEAHEGRGIVTAACRTIVSEGFQRFGLHRIEIRCATWNHRSSAIPRRLGFIEEGILREAQRLHNAWVDLRVFSMLAQDWKPGGNE